MAHKRMFSKDITTSDAFREMPASSQALYFHLGMEADDDGFLDNYRGLMRSINASDDDLRVLIGKRFLILFPSKVVVVKHWRINNTIRLDRYSETKHLEEKRALIIKENGAYTEVSDGLPNGNQVAPQYSIEEKRRDTSHTVGNQEYEVTDENAKPTRDKTPTPSVQEILDIWNTYPNWKSTGKKVSPRNPSVAETLLIPAKLTSDLKAGIIRKRSKYSLQEIEDAVKAYATEIANRPKDAKGFYLHRFSAYEFFTYKQTFERYANR